MSNRMTGYAPVNQCYNIAGGILFPGRLVLCLTRCRYATLALMARQGGDLLRKDVGRRGRRLKILESWDVIRYSTSRRCWELTAKGWNLLVDTEAVWYLSQEAKGV